MVEIRHRHHVVTLVAFVAAPRLHRRKIPLCQHSWLVKLLLMLVCPLTVWFPTLRLYPLVCHAPTEVERCVPQRLQKLLGIRLVAKAKGGDRPCANKWDCRSAPL